MSNKKIKSMKKKLFLLGVAVTALASCTNEETMDAPQSRAIEFSTFVNSTTRAVTEISGKDDLNTFYVYGNYDESGTWTPVYNGDAVVKTGGAYIPTITQYWAQESKSYQFAAYSNGNTKLDNVTFTPVDKKLEFADYTATESDLIVAIPNTIISEPEIGANVPIGLSFYHALTQVKFTFKNTDAQYKLKITDIKIGNAVTTATAICTYAAEGQAPTITWTGEANGEYNFGSIEDITANEASLTCFVIPQNNENLTVSFHAAMYNVDDEEETTPVVEKNYTDISVAYTPTTGIGEVNQWTPGFRYNYTSEINAGKLGLGQPMDFTVDAINKWEDADPSTVGEKVTKSKITLTGKSFTLEENFTTQPDHTIDMLVDGIIYKEEDGTSNYCQTRNLSMGTNMSCVIDLGESISALEMKTYQRIKSDGSDSPDKTQAPRVFDLYVSADGSEWEETPIYTFNEAVNAPVFDNPEFTTGIIESETPFQYIKWVIKDRNMADREEWYFALSEIEIYKCESTEQ